MAKCTSLSQITRPRDWLLGQSVSLWCLISFPSLVDFCFHVQMVHAQSLSSVWLFATPWTVVMNAGSSIPGIFQARILEWLAPSSSRGFSWPRNQTQVSCVSCIGSGILTTEPLGKAAHESHFWRITSSASYFLVTLPSHFSCWA